MDYRKLKNGVRAGCLGLGAGRTGCLSAEEAVKMIRAAGNHGVNFIDMYADQASAFGYVGEAVKNRRKDVILQLHFGADYSAGGYQKKLDLSKAMNSVTGQMQTMRIDYLDYACLHEINSGEDLKTIIDNGLMDLVKELKSGGVVRGISVLSSDLNTAEKLLGTGIIDLLMVPEDAVFGAASAFGEGTAADENAAFGEGTASGKDAAAGWSKLLARCAEEGTDAVLRLNTLNSSLSALLRMQRALDLPAVKTVISDIGSLDELYRLLHFFKAKDEEKRA